MIVIGYSWVGDTQGYTCQVTCQGKSYFYFWKQMCIPPADESRVNDSEGPMII
jgi:hypothetical protein